MLKSLLIACLLAPLCLSGAACTQKGDCEKTVDHILELIQAELGGDAKIDVAKERAELLAKCKEDDGVTMQQQQCVLAAKKLRDLAACDRPR